MASSSDDPTTPKRRGRPPGSIVVTEPRAGVSVWLPQTTFDRLYKVAQQREESLSATVRHFLTLTLKE
jgi:hypothetical protein